MLPECEFIVLYLREYLYSKHSLKWWSDALSNHRHKDITIFHVFTTNQLLRVNFLLGTMTDTKVDLCTAIKCPDGSLFFFSF